MIWKLRGFVLLLIIQTVFTCILDNNFLYHIKSLTLPILRQFDSIFYIRVTTILSNGAFDAICPYIGSTTGIYSNIPKRPENESTIQNKNIAIAYASLRILNSMLPRYTHIWRHVLLNVSLDPNDTSIDLTTPIGIGNYAAKNILNFRINDGMNQNGDFSRPQYNKMAYENYFGNYIPKNNEYILEYPDHWQPNIESDGNGIFRSQIHLSPQYGSIQSYSKFNKSRYECPIPTKSQVNNFDDYVYQTNQVLNASYELNDKKKLMAEFFNDKILSLENTLEFLIEKNKLNLQEYVFLQISVKAALFDAGIIIWKEKIKHDSIRPFSTIRYLFKNALLKAWGGPGAGSVEDIRGQEWQSYLRTPEYAEYPSASACFCSAQAKILVNYFKTDDLNLIVYHAKGSSKIEPNAVPSKNIILKYNTLSDFVNECGISRLNGGVNFLSAIQESQIICKLIADESYKYFQKHFYGL